jgi:hypothetical protein
MAGRFIRRVGGSAGKRRDFLVHHSAFRIHH